jgi:CheY-like chemotaxis protein
MALDALDILLVDDNPYMRRIVVAVLRGAGINNIREVGDGSEALTQLRHRPADIAIVDFNMFPLDGVQFTKLLRNSPDSPNPFLPIIMMTGHSERSRVMEARDAGVTEFVVKPVTAKALLSRLNAVIFYPRPFIRTESYFGPDRRRQPDPAYAGPMRRSTDRAASDYVAI